jgi:hypothetical protein
MSSPEQLADDVLRGEDLSHTWVADGEDATEDAAALPLEWVAVAALQDHPQNYRRHPPDQIAHIKESLRLHGLYRNIVVAEDDTILAGHGVVRAIRELGWARVPVVRRALPPDHPLALKLLAGDNEISHLAEVEDRKLTEMLRGLKEAEGVGLLGTGYDEMMLANLLFVTRPESEIADRDEAAHWVGMPEYEPGERPPQLMISFATEAEKIAFLVQIGVTNYRGRGGRVWTCWYPDRAQDDTSSLEFVG